MPHYSKTLPMDKCIELAPRFCGPFKVLKCIGLLAYHLALPDGHVRIHLVSHLSGLKEFLRSSKNIVTIKSLLISKNLPSKSHLPERFFNVKTKHLWLNPSKN